VIARRTGSRHSVGGLAASLKLFRSQTGSVVISPRRLPGGDDCRLAVIVGRRRDSCCLVRCAWLSALPRRRDGGRLRSLGRRLFCPPDWGRRLLFVVTIGVLGCAAAPSSLETGARGTSAAAFSSKFGRRVLFAAAIAGASIATASRFRGGRL
jgi:hypothetical protein